MASLCEGDNESPGSLKANAYLQTCYRYLSTDKFISGIVPGPSQWFFHFGEKIVIAWIISEVLDSSSGVTPCIGMKNDGILYHQVSSFSPEDWTKVVLQEPAVVVRVCRLLWRYSVVQYYPINVIRHNEQHFV
ncbi:hypothetical protein ANN_14005 [Periplaneta americana]|uniref:Uncharacterized protein n=1 Tax=Periplaneta americana TaxID=6978 RepID=A0ABQ8SWB5_PERAM|nr:hypothetical protein ANN_14005 [Periplaneta americana]